MRRFKKSIFLGGSFATFGILAIVRCVNPDVVQGTYNVPVQEVADSLGAAPDEKVEVAEKTVNTPSSAISKSGILFDKYSLTDFKDEEGKWRKSKIYSVPSFRNTFPDLQDVQVVSARKWGVGPVRDRKEAEVRKEELVFVGSNPYYTMDSRMHHSIPYLVPRASELLQKIARNFLDSLAVKHIPLHTIIVTSVLRTDEDVSKLRRVNVNASPESCHRFGTTFDITYNRYTTVQSPHGPERRAVRNDTLKWVLSEVLRDLRQEGKCYVKYEVKQACYHITVR